jgi:nucleoside-diphosphate-sugar epimerase
MRVFVAGGSGAIGVPLVKALVQEGHQVTALTRSPGKQDSLMALGATPAVADALDAAALQGALLEARPTHVIHQLTALPKDGVRRASDLEPTNRLRIEGTRNLLDAAIAAGATRLIVGSFAPLQGIGADVPQEMLPGKNAVDSMEEQTLEASRAGRIEGIVLRYGLFYGPENPATKSMIALARRRMLPVVKGDRSLLPCIHVDDAARATVAALDHGDPGSVYDIVDDEPVSMTELVQTLSKHVGAAPPFTVPEWLVKLFAPYLVRITSMRLPLSNEKAREELGWRPTFSSWRDGLEQTVARAA